MINPRFQELNLFSIHRVHYKPIRLAAGSPEALIHLTNMSHLSITVSSTFVKPGRFWISTGSGQGLQMSFPHDTFSLR